MQSNVFVMIKQKSGNEHYGAIELKLKKSIIARMKTLAQGMNDIK